MKRKLALIFSISLLMVEIASFLWVLHANLTLQQDLTLLAGTEDLLVPNSHLAPSLGKIMPAIWGSLFVTFTAGLIISMVICFFSLIYMMNRANPGGQKTGRKSLVIRLVARLTIPGIFLIGALIILATFTDQSIFHRTRDYLLLSNPLGTVVSNVYYTYSPYAVNAIAPPFEKLVKTVWISPHAGNNALLKHILSKFGWFQVATQDATSFILQNTDPNHLTFLENGKTIVTVAEADFIADPARYLRQYAQQTDTARFIRGVCVVGLLMGIPICLFSLVFLAYAALLSLIMPVIPARVVSGILVLATVSGLSAYLYPAPPANLDEIRNMLSSQTIRYRIEALRHLNGKGMDISDIQDTLNAKIHSQSIAERYWVAKLLAQSKAPQSIHVLEQMINDPEIIVASAAIKSLFKRSANSRTIALFKTIAHTRPEWYVQITAYHAVKAYHGR